MPARRKKRRGTTPKSNYLGRKIIIYLFFLIIIFILPLYIFSSRKFWKDDQKLSVAVNTRDGVSILTFDPRLSEISEVYIPENTQVEVANGLGIWKIGVVWELGEQEEIGGLLLARTVTKHFKFPVAAWADEPALGLRGNNYQDALKAVIFPYKSNLSLGDKAGLLTFSLRVKNPKRVQIDLSETAFLESTQLKDGTQGYLVTREPPARIKAIFADEQISEKNLRIKIIDKSGIHGLAEEIGDIIEVLGGKVAVIEKSGRQEMACLIRSKEKNIGEKLISYIPCELQNEDPESFDVEIEIGEGFGTVY